RRRSPSGAADAPASWRTRRAKGQRAAQQPKTATMRDGTGVATRSSKGNRWLSTRRRLGRWLRPRPDEADGGRATQSRNITRDGGNAFDSLRNAGAWDPAKLTRFDATVKTIPRGAHPDA